MNPFKFNIIFQGSVGEFEKLKKKATENPLNHLSFYRDNSGDPLQNLGLELNQNGALVVLPENLESLTQLQLFLSQLKLDTPARSFEMKKACEFRPGQKLYWPCFRGQRVEQIRPQNLADFADALVASALFYYPQGFLIKNKNQVDFMPVYVPADSKREGPLQKALFLDRDGVVIKDAGYHVDAQKLELIPETLELMRKASSQGYLIVVLTNQSGIARGFFTQQQVELLHRELDQRLQAEGVSVAGWFSSPYHFKKGEGVFKKHSLTRKPGPGLVLQALEKWPIDLSASLMIGDKPSDDLDVVSLRTFHLQGAYELEGVVSPVLNSALEALDHL